MVEAGAARAADADLRLSSIGYVAQQAKRATVLGAPSGVFVVRRAADDTEAFQGELVARGEAGIADFTVLEEEGSFLLEVEGVGRSVPFPIGREAYVEPYRAAMLGFYAWRSGIDVAVALGGQTWSHSAGHLEDAYLDFVGQPGVLRDGTGGWYDAGDYGKYIVNSAITMGLLLQAWEDFRANIEPVSLEIPEAGGTLPDFLDELRFQLDWMLKMQFDDGTVSHKITPVDFPEYIQPVDDTAPRYFSPWGSAATAGFAATMAKAARVYREFDSAYAEQLEAAAVKSYEFLTANPGNHAADMSDFEQAQYQTTDGDDRVWAAAELWETTGDADALADFETRARALEAPVLGDWDWGSQSNLGIFTYLRSERSGRDEGLVSDLEAAVVTVADEHVTLADSIYGRGLEAVYWGSNGTVARICSTLHVAYILTGSEGYVGTCADQLAHLLGRNEYGRSQVTCVGLDPPAYPHDRRSMSDGIDAPYPGYLVGGASSPGNWTDEQESYETNEIAINWQGAFVYALAAFVTPPDEPSGGAGTGGAGGVEGTVTEQTGGVGGEGAAAATTGEGSGAGGTATGGVSAVGGGDAAGSSVSGGSGGAPGSGGAGGAGANGGAPAGGVPLTSLPLTSDAGPATGGLPVDVPSTGGGTSIGPEGTGADLTGGVGVIGFPATGGLDASPPPDEAEADESGCGCRTVEERRGGGWTLAGLLVLGAACRRRRGVRPRSLL